MKLVKLFWKKVCIRQNQVSMLIKKKSGGGWSLKRPKAGKVIVLDELLFLLAGGEVCGLLSFGLWC